MEKAKLKQKALGMEQDGKEFESLDVQSGN